MQSEICKLSTLRIPLGPSAPSAPSPPEGICCQKRYNGSYSNLQIARKDKGANSQLQGYYSAPGGKNDPDDFGFTKYRWHLF